MTSPFCHSSAFELISSVAEHSEKHSLEDRFDSTVLDFVEMMLS